MIYVIVPLPALWLVAWQCTAKRCCDVPSPASHLSSSSPSPLPQAFAGFLPTQRLSTGDCEGWVVITPAFNHSKNEVPGPNQLSCVFLALMGGAEAPTLPYTCPRMDEGAHEP